MAPTNSAISAQMKLNRFSKRIKIMSEHTKEPWVYDNSDNHSTMFYSDDATGSIIGECAKYMFAPRPIEERKANARRIVACVNALEGLTTEQIEEGVLQNMREDSDFLAAEVNALTKQRDELLKALHDAATSLETIQLRSFGADSYLDDKHSVMAYAGSRASVARESIAKAKGVTK